jgi:urease accessory protein
MRLNRSTLALLALSTPAPVLAHAGSGSQSVFVSGFLHPLGGLDHVLAMVTVGLLAAALGGRAILGIPAAVIGMMILGGLLGAAGVELPGFEWGIAASVIVLGLMVARGGLWPSGTVTGLVGTFGVFHGYAHGVTLPAASGAAIYMLGFASTTLLLHVGGITAGVLMQSRRDLVRVAGAGMAITGLGLAFS